MIYLLFSIKNVDVQWQIYIYMCVRVFIVYNTYHNIYIYIYHILYIIYYDMLNYEKVGKFDQGNDHQPSPSVATARRGASHSLGLSQRISWARGGKYIAKCSTFFRLGSQNQAGSFVHHFPERILWMFLSI